MFCETKGRVGIGEDTAERRIKRGMPRDEEL